MKKEQIKDKIIEAGLVAVVRSNDLSEAKMMIEAIIEGGFQVIEITYTIKDAGALIQYFNQDKYKNILIGAGTVTTPSQAENAIQNHAKFIVGPGFNEDVFEYCRLHDLLYIPGVLTPSEVMNGVEHGLTLLKLFPGSLGGSKYLKALQGPFPEVSFMPTGGVNIDNIKDWIDAGAMVLGIGSDLTNTKEHNNPHPIREQADKYIQTFQKVRKS